MKVVLISLLLLSTFWSNGQTQDTVWVHRYETGFNRFELRILNQSHFILTDYIDTIYGSIIRKNDTIRFDCDTVLLTKSERKISRDIKSNLSLIYNTQSRLPVLHLSSNKKERFSIDTIQKSKSLTGTYFTSNLFMGCNIQILENGRIEYKSYSCLGETIEMGKWSLRKQNIRLNGKTGIDKWYTDERILYRIPFHLVGKKVETNPNSCTITLTYFIREDDDFIE